MSENLKRIARGLFGVSGYLCMHAWGDCVRLYINGSRKQRMATAFSGYSGNIIPRMLSSKSNLLGGNVGDERKNVHLPGNIRSF